MTLQHVPLSAEVDAAVAALWDRARARWATALMMSRPTGTPDDNPTVAAIDLRTRQIVVNEKTLRAKDLLGALEGIVSHEVGHHVAWPGSLVTHARLRLTERTLLPFARFSLTNLFYDLLINERLGDELRHQLSAVYIAFASDDVELAVGGFSRNPTDLRQDFAFAFVMCAYEELWNLAPGTILRGRQQPLEARFAGVRADARLLVERLFVLGPNLTTQFLFFVSVLSRYLIVDESNESSEPADEHPCPCGGGEPSPEDWAEALTPTKQEQEAVERALREGWLSTGDADRLRDGQLFERRVLGLPGQGTADASMVPEVMAAWYRRQAHSYLLKPPSVRLRGEATVPTDLVPWEPGDSVGDVDWAATLREHGAVLGRALPLVRDRLADEEGLDTALWAPRCEIYLDVSGSMPDPRLARNALTLAALILTVATVRAGGSARALLYSTDHVKLWRWCRSDVEISRFLMHYMGGGTTYPFAVLASSVEERHVGADGAKLRPIRVVITDHDFDQNVASEANGEALLRRAATASAPFVLLQHNSRPHLVARYRGWGLTVVEVATLDDFPRLAADLARALFPQTNSK